MLLGQKGALRIGMLASSVEIQSPANQGEINMSMLEVLACAQSGPNGHLVRYWCSVTCSCTTVLTPRNKSQKKKFRKFRELVVASRRTMVYRKISTDIIQRALYLLEKGMDEVAEACQSLGNTARKKEWPQVLT